MMNNVLVVAPHPDDETLACAGTLLKLKDFGKKIHWLIITQMQESQGYDPARIQSRNQEINRVSEAFAFDSVCKWGIPTTTVDTLAFGDLVKKASRALEEIQPDTLLLPFYNDVHSDHSCTSKAFLSCCKWFRHPYLKSILFYETISETDFNINSTDTTFNPNIYIDISDYFDKKVKILSHFSEELGDFPFPRSIEAIESLAKLRGAQCGAHRAESFCLLRSVF